MVDVQENRTTLEKFDKKSSERKKDKVKKRGGKYPQMWLYTCRTFVRRVRTCRTCVGRVRTWRTCVRRVKNVQQTTVEKFEKVYKNSSERKSRRGKKPQIWFNTWRTCVERATRSF